MSERPTDTNPSPARVRRPWWRLRDLPIWSKLGLIMIVPTLATVVVGTNSLAAQVDTANTANRVRVLANLASTTGELVHHLQEERAAAVLLLGASGDSETEEQATVYSVAQQPVDEVERRFQSQSAALTDVPTGFRDLLTDVRGQLSVLPQTRNQVSSGSFGLTDAAASYEKLITNLIDMRDASAQFAGDVDLGNRLRAAASLARAKELLSQQRVVGHEVLIRGAYHPHLRSAFIGAQTGHEQALQSFSAVATGAEQEMLDQALEGPDVRQSQLYQDYLDSLDGTRLGDPPWDAAAWDGVMAAHANLLRAVEEQLDEVTAADAVALRDAVTQRVLVELSVLLAMLMVAILLAWLVARSMARSLRELRQGALAVAQSGLPQAVARLRDPALSTQLSPAQVASQIAEPLPVRGKDEFGQVAEAFNAVHLEAVRTAAEQAQLRSSVATMFVNLARRSQILVDRLINHLDRLERGEEDPDRLAELFQLDHLATRMRRNDENLLVLAGADSTRVQRQPAALIDVLRAAQSEVEHYTRVEFGLVDRDLEIAAHAVNDMVHLVAELLDNATAFSPPDSQVMVEARRVGDRAVLYVEDRGLGLSREQLADINERLANPPLVDVAVSRMMGLVVVSRLAARHGVKVALRPATERGTVADVTLPGTVLAPRTITHDRPGPAPRGSGEQLALERGPADPPSRTFTPPSFSPPSFAAPPSRPVPSPFSPAPYQPPISEPADAEAFTSPAPWPTSPAPQAAPLSSRPGRAMPAWSDLTGVNGSSDQPRSGSEPISGAEPGPADGHDEAERPAGTSATGPLPRRRPGSYHGSEPPERLDASSIPRPRGGVTSPAGSPESAPPQWPPVAPATATPMPTEAAASVANEADPSQPAEPAPPPTPASPGMPTPGIRVPPADVTMELPIFQELESKWFRSSPATPSPQWQAADPGEGSQPSRQPANRPPWPPATAGGETMELVTIDGPTASRGDPSPAEPVLRADSTAAAATNVATGASVAMGDAMKGDVVREPSVSASETASPAEYDWRTAADEGWLAASSAADAPVQERTAAGLPKRRPMAQLVPGGVERARSSAQHRSPEAVRGLLSAYHRGVQRGREQTTVDEPSGPGGTQSTQAGKERRT